MNPVDHELTGPILQKDAPSWAEVFRTVTLYASAGVFFSWLFGLPS